MKKVFLIILTLAVSAAAFAQIETPVRWSYAAKRVSKTEVMVLLKASIQDGWHIYSQHVKEGGPLKTEFTFTPSKEYVLVGITVEPTPIIKYEKVFKMNVGYFEKEVVFQQKINLKTEKPVMKGKLEFIACKDKCIPPEEIAFSIPVV